MKIWFTRLRGWGELALGRTQPVSQGQRRYVRLGQAALTALASKGMGILVSVISVPLVVEYLGAERYGVWIIISTLLGWLGLAELGLGSGLINVLSEAYGQERPDLARRYVATAFWLMLLVALLVGGVIIFVWRWIDWPSLFNVHSTLARAEVATAVALAVALFLMNLPLSLVTKIYGACQEGAVANGWAAAGNAASLLALLGVTKTHGGLIWLVGAVFGMQLLVAVASAIYLFAWHKPWLRPHPLAIQREGARKLISIGGAFFAVQVIALLNMQTDNFIIAHFLGAHQVTPYSVAYRLFSYTALLQILVFPALWPAYAEAIARRDLVWVRRTLRASLWLNALASFSLALLLITFGKQIIKVWAGPEAVPTFALLAWLGCWSVASNSMNAVACFLNAAGHLKGQMIYGLLTAVVNIIASILLVRRFGVTGVIVSTVVSYLICNVGPQLIEAKLVLKAFAQESSSGLACERVTS